MYVHAELAQPAEWPSNKEAWASALHYFPFRIESACRGRFTRHVVKLRLPKLNGGLRNLRGRGENSRFLWRFLPSPSRFYFLPSAPRFICGANRPEKLSRIAKLKHNVQRSYIRIYIYIYTERRWMLSGFGFGGLCSFSNDCLRFI